MRKTYIRTDVEHYLMETVDFSNMKILESKISHHQVMGVDFILELYKGKKDNFITIHVIKYAHDLANKYRK